MYPLNTYPTGPNFIRCANDQTFSRYKVVENRKSGKILKNLKSEILKIQNSTIVWTIEQKIQEKFGAIEKRFEEGVEFFLKIVLALAPMLTETKKKTTIENFKNPKQYFCDHHSEETSGEVWKFF